MAEVYISHCQLLWKVSKLTWKKNEKYLSWDGTVWWNEWGQQVKKERQEGIEPPSITESNFFKKKFQKILSIIIPIKQKKFWGKISIFREVTLILLTQPKNTKHTIMGFWRVKLTWFNFLRLELPNCHFCRFLCH